MAFTNNGDGSVTDSVSGLTWKRVPSELKLWDEAAIADAPAGFRIPTLDELQSLLADQKADLAGCTAAFGEDNLPTDWFWVHKIDPAREAVWSAGPKTEALAEELSLEKPGHIAAYFVWMGRQPANNRRIEARCRYVQI